MPSDITFGETCIPVNLNEKQVSFFEVFVSILHSMGIGVELKPVHAAVCANEPIKLFFLRSMCLETSKGPNSWITNSERCTRLQDIHIYNKFSFIHVFNCVILTRPINIFA